MRNIVIVAGNASEELIYNLRSKGFKVIKTIKCLDTYKQIMYHPDIVITKVDNNTLLIDPKYYKYYKNKLLKFDINIIKGYKSVTDKYPGNIRYNLATVGKKAIHNFKYTDENLINILNKEDFELINVNQGYSKCSTVTLGDKGIITSDIGIYKQSKQKGIKSLLIDNKQIELPGFDYGFIGGASGFYKDTLYLTGSIENHSSKDQIKSFLDKLDIKMEFLSSRKIIDLGSLIFI